MKQSVIKETTVQDLRDKLAEETALLAKLKLNHAVSPIENPLKIKATRKNVARIQTELRKRELQGK
ncbi:MAG: 50S ribosomal protein L29 [Bacteroidia bacterium]|nr:50S ribosomal protein L29 [Bacteroidia bacterium]